MEMGREKWKEKMKGSEIAASLAIVLSLLCLLPVGASAQAVVAIDNASALPNETTTTNVTAYNVTNLGNFGITVTYDPSVVSVTNVTGGPGVGNFMWEKISDGVVQFYTVNTLEIPSLGGEVVLATLTLRAVGAAGSESPLKLEIGKLLDNKNNSISAIPKNGTFKILTAPPVEVKINDASAQPGKTTNTKVVAYDVENLGNFGITVTYDPSVVNVTNVTGGPGVGNFTWEKISDGVVRFYTVNTLEIPSLSGDITLATLTLKAVGAAGSESPLNLEIGQLLDNKSNPIPAIPKNGTFKVLTPEEVAYITVSPSAATLNVGETRVFTATAYDGDGNPLEGVLINWTSTNETVGTVRPTASITDENGVARTNFTAISPGNTTVTAGNLTDAGWIIGYADVTVIPTDTTPPTTEVIATPPEPATGWWNSSVMLTFHRYDDLSGVDYTAYWMAGANATSLTQVFGEDNFTVNITAEGNTTVYYLSRDKAGNREDLKSMNVSIDRTPPVIISVKLDKTEEVYPGEKINVTVNATDALSGILTVTADNISLTYIPRLNIWYGTITAKQTQGIHNVTVKAIDRAFNIAVNDTVQYEVKEPPRLAKIVIPPELTLNVSETKEIVAIAYDQYNETMEGIVINWFIYGSKIGDVYPTTSMTDEKGVAKTNFTALKAGKTAVVAVNRTINRTIYNATIVIVRPKKNFTVRIEPSMIRVNVSATVYVDVRDADTSMPVEGATVNLSGCGVTLSGTTNASGIAIFEVKATSTGNITVTVSKTGYKTWTKEDGIVVGSALMEGDVDMNGCVDILDALLIAQYDVGLITLNASQLKCADTTDDGNVDISDAMHIAQYTVDPDGSLGVLRKPLWESPADEDMLKPMPCV